MSQQQSHLRIVAEQDFTRVEFAEKHVIDEIVIRQIGQELTKIVDAAPRPRVAAETALALDDMRAMIRAGRRPA